jgi:hypothetical protein
MSIQEAIYNLLSNSQPLLNIFGYGIYPLSSKKQKLPVLFYSVSQTEVNPTKTSKSLFNVYSLTIDLFSMDYIELCNASDILKNILDNKEILNGNEVLVNVCRFQGFTEDYNTTDELFTKTVNFNLYTAY